MRIGNAILLMLSILLISCGRDEKASLAMPDYKNWKKPIKKAIDYPIPGHGSGFRIIYANDKAFASTYIKDARGVKRLSVPDGAIVTKESYKSRKEVNKKEPVVYVMIKDRKSKSAQDGWIYALKKPGEGLNVITSGMCIGCHDAANEKHPYFDGNPEEIFRDYLFAPLIK